jgi:RHS repeat-associated protein
VSDDCASERSGVRGLAHKARQRRAWVALALLLAVVAVPGAALSAGPTNVSGAISSNTTWTAANSPYIVTGNVTVAAGVTLTIEPGVVVKLNNQFREIKVNGTLTAIGTEALPITFTSIQDDTVGGDSNGDGSATSPAPAQWYRIHFAAGTASELRYVNVRNGGYGSANWGYGAIAVDNVGTSVLIDRATITGNQRSGIKVFEGSVTVSASTISDNGNGISVNQGRVVLKDRSFVTDNAEDGVWFNLTSTYAGLASSVMESDVADNGRYGIYIGAQPALPASKYPYGTRNNIYGNATRQLDNYFERRDVDWTGNYWGANVYHWVNQALCRGTGKNSWGRLATRPTSQTPGAGPVLSSSYTVGQTSCAYDKLKIGPDEFSPYYLEPPYLPLESTYGGVSGTGHSKGKAVLVSDPVNAATGSLTHESTDLTVPGTGVAFSFTRAYNSLDPTDTPLGVGWQHNHAISLSTAGSGSAVTVRLEDGQRFRYWPNSSGSGYLTPPGALSTLAAVSGGYALTRNDQVVYAFDSQGRLLSVKDRNDQGLTYSYDGGGKLQSVTDAASRVHSFGYDAAGRLTSVTTADGRTVGLGYTDSRLTSVTDAAGEVWTYTYEGRGLLEKEIDPLSHTVFRNVYDHDGRVIEQYDALNNKTSFAWDHLTQKATVTDPRSNEWKHFFQENVPLKEVAPLGNETVLGHGSQLDQTSATSPSGATTSMTYDARGNLTEAVAPASLQSATKTMSYDADNNLITVVDARGKVTSYGYDGDGNNTTVTQDGQTVATYTYDTAGRVLTSTDGRGNSTGYTYDANGNLASVTDPLGNKTTYSYDSAGRMTSRVDPLGNVTGANPLDYTWTWTYDSAGRTLTEADPLGNTTTYTYDDAGNKLTETDARNKTITYAYNAANQLVSITAPDGGVTTYTYDAAGNKLTETNPRNHTTAYTYDANNRLASTTTPLGNKTTYFYDADGNQTKVVEPRGNVAGANPDDYATTSTYDAAGRLLTETNPLGQTTTYTYDKVGNQLTVTDPRGKVTTNTYDGRNRLASVTAADGGVTSYTYDGNGNQLTRTDPRGKVWTSTYELANRLASSTTPLGNKTTYFYDANGRQTKVVEPRGNVSGANPDDYATVSTYDRAGRLLTSTDPLGNPTSHAYDAVGNKLSVTDAANKTTGYTYDSVNRLASVIAADLTTTSYSYDLAGNLTSRTDANNHTTTYTFDADDRRTAVTSPIGQTWTTSYDAAGNVRQTVDANGNATPTSGDGTTTNTYDRAGRLTGIDYSDATPDVTNAYDAAGNRTTMTDGAGTETRSYDDANRLAEVTRGTDTFSYVYDLGGNLTRRTYPGSTMTEYTFDDDSRIATVTSGGATTTYDYDAAGNQTMAALPIDDGHIETRTYDRAGRLSRLGSARAGTTLVDFDYSLDAVGNPTQVVRTGTLPGSTTYTYDSRHRLSEVCFAASCVGASDYIRWTYDDVGNRLSEIRPSGSTSYAYNAGDQLTVAGSTSYTYDANGNQVSAGARGMSYDLQNRIVSLSEAGMTTTYSYDGDSKRVEVSTGSLSSQTVRYLWDVEHALPQLALERDGNGSTLRYYLYGKRRVSVSSGTSSYYAYDALGSVVALTSNGTPQWSYAYEPFGTSRAEAKHEASAPANSMRFSGELLDATGVYHLRARQYEPALGAFQGIDPAERAIDAPAVSTYVYAENQPTVMVDPSGESAIPSDDGASTLYTVVSPVALPYQDSPGGVKELSDGPTGYRGNPVRSRDGDHFSFSAAVAMMPDGCTFLSRCREIGRVHVYGEAAVLGHWNVRVKMRIRETKLGILNPGFGQPQVRFTCDHFRGAESSQCGSGGWKPATPEYSKSFYMNRKAPSGTTIAFDWRWNAPRSKRWNMPWYYPESGAQAVKSPHLICMSAQQYRVNEARDGEGLPCEFKKNDGSRFRP